MTEAAAPGRRWIPLVILTAACATAAGMRTEPLELGTARTYRAALEQALSATQAAFARSEFKVDTLTRPDSATWMLVGIHPGGLIGGQGELIRAVGRSVTDSTTEVRILTKRVSPTDLWAKGDWSPTLFIYLGAFLGDSGLGDRSLHPVEPPRVKPIP